MTPNLPFAGILLAFGSSLFFGWFCTSAATEVPLTELYRVQIGMDAAAIDALVTELGPAASLESGDLVVSLSDEHFRSYHCTLAPSGAVSRCVLHLKDGAVYEDFDEALDHVRDSALECEGKGP